MQVRKLLFVNGPPLAALRLLALAVLAIFPGLAAAAGDPRQVFDGNSPDWLRAIGKLTVPAVQYQGGYPSHHRENCSATLVSEAPGRRADTLLTAWHCLEDYRDLSRPITVTLRGADGGAIVREAYRAADGGGMHADWAVLKLSRAVSSEEVVALPVHPGLADRGLPIIMAGYSGDEGLGAAGQALTYDEGCRITGQQPGESESDCRAFKGASGGAVVQLAPDGKARLCGVISRGDSASVSYFVPLDKFRSAVNRYLN